MSGFAGSVSDRPISAREKALLRRGVKARSSSRKVAQIEGGSFFLCATSDREPAAAQALASDGGASLLLDGTIHNLEEIRHELEPCEAESPAEILLEAYERQGLRFLSRLVGEFALAVTSASNCRVVLARDTFGTRPLYFVHADHGLTWSSSLGSLLELTGADCELDEEFIGEFLTLQYYGRRTPFAGIEAVAPSCWVSLTRERGLCRGRFWDFDLHRRIRYETDSQYEEHFQELLAESLRVRLAGRRRAFAELSGGLDSSAIVCVADKLGSSGGASQLRTVSYVFDGADQSDERKYIRAVERKRGATGIHVDEISHPFFAPLPHRFVPLAYPSVEHLAWTRQAAVVEAMERDGAELLLRGIGGDQVVFGELMGPFELADALAEWRIVQFFRGFGRWSRWGKVPVRRLLAEGALQPLGTRWGAALARGLGWRAGLASVSYLHPDFVRRTDLKERTEASALRAMAASPSSREQLLLILQLAEQVGDFFPSEGKIEVSYPFLHRPLVEYCLAIPPEQKLRPGETRSVLRRALREDLPKTIRRRTDKRGPDQAIYQAFSRLGPQLDAMAEDPEVDRRGFMERDRFLELLKKAIFGIRVNTPFLLRVIALELWLRSLAGRRCWLLTADGDYPKGY